MALHFQRTLGEQVCSLTEPRTNEQWLADLQSVGPAHTAAIEDLREYILRAVLVYLTRHRSDVAGLDYDELQQLAEDWAQQGALQVLAKLPTFRGDSKFTTWAYRVVVNLVAGDLRRKRWESVSLDAMTDAEQPDPRLSEDDRRPSPETLLARSEAWQVIHEVMTESLTNRQRTVLTMVVLDDLPVEEVADRMGTNRNNIYKIVHDARRKLRLELQLRDWAAADILGAFEDEGQR
jgi:RNA polymerase sigma-70 factor (ECF subfamily)